MKFMIILMDGIRKGISEGCEIVDKIMELGYSKWWIWKGINEIRRTRGNMEPFSYQQVLKWKKRHASPVIENYQMLQQLLAKAQYQKKAGLYQE